jgi:hypothetical protein
LFYLFWLSLAFSWPFFALNGGGVVKAFAKKFRSYNLYAEGVPISRMALRLNRGFRG